MGRTTLTPPSLKRRGYESPDESPASLPGRTLTSPATTPATGTDAAGPAAWNDRTEVESNDTLSTSGEEEEDDDRCDGVSQGSQSTSFSQLVQGAYSLASLVRKPFFRRRGSGMGRPTSPAPPGSARSLRKATGGIQFATAEPESTAFTTMPSGAFSMDPIPEEALLELQQAIQTAIVMGAAFFTLAGMLLWLAWHLFFPVMSPVVLAMCVSIIVHPNHRPPSPVARLHKMLLHALHRRGPTNKALHYPYALLVEVALSAMVWLGVLHTFSRVLGLFRMCRPLVRLALQITQPQRQVREAQAAAEAASSPMSPAKSRRMTERTRAAEAEAEAEAAESIMFVCDMVLGALLVGCFCFYFWGNPVFRLGTLGVFFLGCLVMLWSGAERASALVSAVSILWFLGVLALCVAGNVVGEMITLTEYAQTHLTAAGSAINDAVETNNATELFMSYAVKGIEQVADSQNISVSALTGMFKQFSEASGLGTHTLSYATSNETARDQEMMTKLYSAVVAMDYKVLSEVGGGPEFWISLSTALGGTTVTMSSYMIGLVLYAARYIADLIWVGSMVALFVALVNTLTRQEETVSFFLMTKFIQCPDRCRNIDKTIAKHLLSLSRSLLHVFVYHFALTLATLLRFDASYPFTGALAAAFFALFPYLPKYLLAPLPLLLNFLQALEALPEDTSPELVAIRAANLQRLYELIAWVLLPLLFGDAWLFDGIVTSGSGGYMGPKMVVLSVLLGFYNWGSLGVFLGPFIVTMLDSLLVETRVKRKARRKSRSHEKVS